MILCLGQPIWGQYIVLLIIYRISCYIYTYPKKVVGEIYLKFWYYSLYSKFKNMQDWDRLVLFPVFHSWCWSCSRKFCFDIDLALSTQWQFLLLLQISRKLCYIKNCFWSHGGNFYNKPKNMFFEMQHPAITTLLNCTENFGIALF